MNPSSETSDKTTADPAPLESARVRRLELHDALEHMEWTLARASRSEDWVEAVAAALAGLQGALEAHIVDVEAPDGILAEILDHEPRLAHEVAAITAQHAELTRMWDEAEAIVRDPGRDAFRIRRAVTALLGGIAEHRQRGSDLVFEAYSVDIGASE